MDLFSTKVAYASSASNIDTFVGKVDAQIINPLILLLFGLALAYFLYGMLEFIASGINDEKKTIGKSHMLWGVIGLTVMVGVWFILGLILSTLGITYVHPETGAVDTLPAVTTPPHP